MLEGNGLKPTPRALNYQLIRRLSFDLLGVPPTPDEVAAFLSDASHNAYEQLVEKLLTDPRFGERWGRHIHDLHATFLHALGLDHKRLTYRHQGRDYRLTDVFGNVKTELFKS